MTAGEDRCKNMARHACGVQAAAFWCSPAIEAGLAELRVAVAAGAGSTARGTAFIPCIRASGAPALALSKACAASCDCVVRLCHFGRNNDKLQCLASILLQGLPVHTWRSRHWWWW